MTGATGMRGSGKIPPCTATEGEMEKRARAEFVVVHLLFVPGRFFPVGLQHLAPAGTNRLLLSPLLLCS